MERHSFVQMSKLHNVKGRITYITSAAKQENLYATYRTCDNAFWTKLAKENRADFTRSGTFGECIEARELIIALPESYVNYEPQELLKSFTDFYKERYGVECISALHHNKAKTNYHIHLVFSERKLLPDPEIKRASRNMFYDENGRRCRTKKEILAENGTVREGCRIVRKGEVYEQRLFEKKNPRFKEKGFLCEVKEAYTELINELINDENCKLKVYNRDGIYLPMKKIGKRNPNEKNIKANNRAVLKWNDIAAQAVERMPAENIREVKKIEIQQPLQEVFKSQNTIGDLYEKIVNRAAATLVRFFNRWIMYPADRRPEPGEDLFYGMLNKCRGNINKNKERDWER